MPREAATVDSARGRRRVTAGRQARGVRCVAQHRKFIYGRTPVMTLKNVGRRRPMSCAMTAR